MLYEQSISGILQLIFVLYGFFWMLTVKTWKLFKKNEIPIFLFLNGTHVVTLDVEMCQVVTCQSINGHTGQ